MGKRNDMGSQSVHFLEHRQQGDKKFVGHEFLAGFIGMEAVLSKVVAAETVVLVHEDDRRILLVFFHRKVGDQLIEFQQGILLIGVICARNDLTQ